MQSLESSGVVDVPKLLGDEALLSEALSLAANKRFQFLQAEEAPAAADKAQYVVRVTN